MKALKSLFLLALIAFSLPQTSFAQYDAEKPVISTLEAIHDITEDFLLESAELMDDDMLAYRPSVNVRTSAQIFGHIINAQFGICSRALGEESPAEGNYEEIATTKKEILAGLKASFAYCRKAYATITDEAGLETHTFFGGDREQEMTVSSILSFNSTHNYEHYGQLTVYMRMNGIVPPSSSN